MRRILALFLSLLMVFVLCACGSPKSEPSPEPTPEAPSVIKATDHMEIVGVCVDDSYEAKDGSPLKLVYLFYNFIATDENLEIDSKYTQLTINGKNTYKSDHFANIVTAIKYMPNYYYSSYIKKVYLESSQLVAATFYIPAAELSKGRTITVSDYQIPGCEDIFFYTDDIAFYNNGEEIANAIDPDGYEEMMVLFDEADVEKTNSVKKLINGYSWQAYVNSTTYTVRFWADNNFEVKTSVGIKNQGKYSVRNGYLFCTYSSNDYTVQIPYEIENGDIMLDLVEAFDVRG